MTYRVPRPLGERVGDWVPIVLPILLGLTVVAFGAWVSFFADCGSIGWLPMNVTPIRCLRGIMK